MTGTRGGIEAAVPCEHERHETCMLCCTLFGMVFSRFFACRIAPNYFSQSSKHENARHSQDNLLDSHWRKGRVKGIIKPHQLKELVV